MEMADGPNVCVLREGGPYWNVLNRVVLLELCLVGKEQSSWLLS